MRRVAAIGGVLGVVVGLLALIGQPAATNEPGRKSLVLALAPGVAIIRATDPQSGIVRNDATYIVVAP